MDSSCRVKNKIMYILSWRSVSALTRVSFWYLFNKYKSNPLVSAETIRHSSTYIILYISYRRDPHSVMIFTCARSNHLMVSTEFRCRWQTIAAMGYQLLSILIPATLFSFSCIPSGGKSLQEPIKSKLFLFTHEWALTLGLYSLKRHHLIGIGIPIISLRRSLNRLKFMGIPIPVLRPLFSD